MTVYRRVASLAVLVLLAFCSSLAARDLNQDEALALRQQGVILPLEQLLQQAMARHPGSRLLEAELEKKHGEYAYEVELVTTEGVVREIELDASTGKLLKDKADDGSACFWWKTTYRWLTNCWPACSARATRSTGWPMGAMPRIKAAANPMT